MYTASVWFKMMQHHNAFIIPMSCIGWVNQIFLRVERKVRVRTPQTLLINQFNLLCKVV